MSFDVLRLFKQLLKQHNQDVYAAYADVSRLLSSELKVRNMSAREFDKLRMVQHILMRMIAERAMEQHGWWRVPRTDRWERKTF